MTTKHTPGPWEVKESCEPLSTGWNDPKCLVLVNGELLADLSFMDDGSHSANAHLIAAAPELLEALKDIVNGVGRQEGYVVRAQRVIAKAEGKL